MWKQVHGDLQIKPVGFSSLQYFYNFFTGFFDDVQDNVLCLQAASSALWFAFHMQNISFVNGLCCIQPQFQAALLFTQLETFVSNVRNPLKNGLMLDFISSLWSTFCYTKDQNAILQKSKAFISSKSCVEKEASSLHSLNRSSALWNENLNFLYPTAIREFRMRNANDDAAMHQSKRNNFDIS